MDFAEHAVNKEIVRSDDFAGTISRYSPLAVTSIGLPAKPKYGSQRRGMPLLKFTALSTSPSLIPPTYMPSSTPASGLLTPIISTSMLSGKEAAQIFRRSSRLSSPSMQKTSGALRYFHLGDHAGHVFNTLVEKIGHQLPG